MVWANESREGKVNDVLRVANCCSILAKDASDEEDPSEIVVDASSSSSATCSLRISASVAVEAWENGAIERFCTGEIVSGASIA